MADLIIGGLLLLFCLSYTILTNQLPGREAPGMIGPAFMPRLLTGALASLALLLVIQGFRQWRTRPLTPPPPHASGVGGPAPVSLLRPTLALLILLTYPMAMAYAGFLPTTPVFFGTLMAVAGGRDVGRILLVSLLATVVVYVGFQYLFQVPLPKSALF